MGTGAFPLPPELLYQVLLELAHLLPPRTAELARVCLVCREFHDVTAPLLYRHLHAHSPSAHTHLASTLTSHPHLAPHVRTLHITRGSLTTYTSLLSLLAPPYNHLTSLTIDAFPLPPAPPQHALAASVHLHSFRKDEGIVPALLALRELRELRYTMAGLAHAEIGKMVLEGGARVARLELTLEDGRCPFNAYLRVLQAEGEGRSGVRWIRLRQPAGAGKVPLGVVRLLEGLLVREWPGVRLVELVGGEGAAEAVWRRAPGEGSALEKVGEEESRARTVEEWGEEVVGHERIDGWMSLS